MVQPSFHIIVEFMAFLAACIWCRRKENFVFIIFIPFLLYTFINEYVARYYSLVLDKSNCFLYNIYTPIGFAFYTSLICSFIESKRRKIIVVSILFAGLAFSIGNIFFGQKILELNTYSNITLSFLLILSCFIYLFDLVLKTGKIDPPLRIPSFWIVAGLLFFNLGWITINSLFKYATANNLQLFGKGIYFQIMKGLNLLLYSCLIIAFRLCYKKMKSIY